MNNKFIQKYTKEVVTYSGIVLHEKYSEEVDIFSKHSVDYCLWCIECVTEYGVKKVIPVLDFMNVYEPYSTKTDEMMTALYNSINEENNVPQQESKYE